MTNDLKSIINSAFQATEAKLREEYNSRVGKNAAILYDLVQNGDGDIISMDSLAQAFLRVYFDYTDECSLEDCVEKFTNLIRDEAYELFNDGDTVMLDSFDEFSSLLEGMDNINHADLYRPVDSDYLDDEAAVMDDPLQVIVDHLHSLEDEELVNLLAQCSKVLSRLGRSYTDLDEVHPAAIIVALKAMETKDCVCLLHYFRDNLPKELLPLPVSGHFNVKIQVDQV